MKRFHQLLLLGSFLPLCWLGMMLVHEGGHVAGAWATGGTVRKIVLHPLAISRTDVSPNPQPLAVAWLGPLVGVALPLLGWAAFNWAGLLFDLRRRQTDAASASFVGSPPGFFETTLACVRFFAGFCLIANGVYLGVGSWGLIGDAGDLQRNGAPAWTLWLFGGVAVAGGLLLWNGQGAAFGLGKSAGQVNARTAYLTAALLIVLIIFECTLSDFL